MRLTNVKEITNEGMVKELPGLVAALASEESTGIELIKYLDPSILKNPIFMKEMLKVSSTAAQYLELSLEEDKEVILEVMKAKPVVYTGLSEELQKDKDLIEAGSMNDFVIKSFPKETFKDKEMIRRIYKKNIRSLSMIDPDFLADNIELVKDLMEIDTEGYPKLPLFIRGHNGVNQVVLSKPCPYFVIEKVMHTIRDKEKAMEAIKINPMAITLCSTELKGDKDLVKQAASNSYLAFRHVADHVEIDKEFAKELVTMHTGMLAYMTPNFRNDKDVVLAAVKAHPVAFEDVNVDLQIDEDVIMTTLDAIIAKPGKSVKVKKHICGMVEKAITPMILFDGHEEIKKKLIEVKKAIMASDKK